MSISIDLQKKNFLQKLQRAEGSIFNVLHIFALKPLVFEKNEIKWNQTDRHTMESFSQFKASPIKCNQTDNVFFLLAGHKVDFIAPCGANKSTF